MSAAVTVRPRAPLAQSTSVLMVGVSPVSCTTGSGQAVDRQRIGPRGDDGLHVGRIAGFHAPHESVLADWAFGEELLGCAAAHRPGQRGDDHVPQFHPLEHPLIRVAMRVVVVLEPGFVDVEGVRVLHHELAGTQDAGAGPRLVAVLVLDLEEQQREVLVRAVLPLHREGEQLLVRGAEHVVAAAAVLEPKHAVAVLGPAVRRLVRCPRHQSREQNLLPANGVHLLTNDALDLAQHPQTQRQPGVQAGPDGPDVAGADQQLVARHLGVGGVLAQRAQEQLGHAGDHSRPPYAMALYSSPASTASRVYWAAAIWRAEKPIRKALTPTSSATAATHSSE